LKKPVNHVNPVQIYWKRLGYVILITGSLGVNIN
jgi:hypothetical protein